MRTVLFLWVAPVAFLVVWFILASNDWSMGMHLFSREVYDEVLRLYAQILGIQPDVVPGMIGRIAAFDAVLIAAYFAWRKRAWIRARFAPQSAEA